MLHVFRNQRLFLLVLILLLGAAVRIVHLGDQSLWLDEGIAYWNQKQPDLIAELATKDVHPPLYFAALNVWIRLTGITPEAMRLSSALLSLISVALVARLAWMLRRDPKLDEAVAIPVMAALLLALFDPEISLAQDVRMYALRTLEALTAIYFYILWLRGQRPLHAVLMVTALVLLLHTHLIGAFMLPVIGLHALLFLRGRVRVGAWALIIGAFALFMPWFLTYGIHQRLNDTGIFAALPSNWTTIVEIGFKYFSQMWALMIGLFVFGLVRLEYLPDGAVRVRWRPFAQSFLLFVWAALVPVATFIANFFYDFLSPRRILLISPAIALLTARGLANFKQVPARYFLVGVIVIYSLSVVDDYYPKAPWDDVGDNLARYATVDELVLMEIYRDDFTFDYYVDYDMGMTMPRESLRRWREDRAAEYPDGLIAQLTAAPTVWLVHWSPDDSAFRFLRQSGHVPTAKMTVDHIGNALDLWRFDRFLADEAPLMTYARTAPIADTLHLRRAEIAPERVDLWWSAPATPSQDYTTSVFLLDASGALVAQHDAYPFENQRPTTGWGPDEIVYDPHPLMLSGVPAGTYQVGVQVYTWFDNVRSPTVEGADWFIVGTLTR